MGTKEYSIALLFKALADRTRLRLINLMGDDEVCVCFFVEVLKTNQPKISRHLAYLRRAGVVSARREGKWMHYRIVPPSDPHAPPAPHVVPPRSPPPPAVPDQVLAGAAADREMRRDVERLASACCAPQPPVRLRMAP